MNERGSFVHKASPINCYFSPVTSDCINLPFIFLTLRAICIHILYDLCIHLKHELGIGLFRLLNGLISVIPHFMVFFVAVVVTGTLVGEEGRRNSSGING